MDFLRTVFLMIRMHVGRMLLARRTLVLLGIAVVPALPVLLASYGKGRIAEINVVGPIVWVLLIQIILPVVALVAGTAAGAEEIADRTITYVFVRPISRVGFLIGRYFGMMLTVSLVLTLSSSLVFSVGRESLETDAGFLGPVHRDVLEAILFGGCIYTAIFAAMGAVFKHPMIVGLAYAFAFEGLFANLPGTSKALSIQDHLRQLLVLRHPADWFDIGREMGFRVDPDADPIWTLCTVATVALGVGCVVLRRRQVG